MQMNNLSSLLTSESSKIVNTLIEDKVADTARKVASQCSLYIEAHPGLKKANFTYDAKFKRIAVQKVGMTGYSALYEKPDLKGVWRTWMHVNPKIIGIDMATLYEAGLEKLCDKIIVIDAPLGNRIKWLNQSRNWESDEIVNRMQSQWDVNKKKMKDFLWVSNNCRLIPGKL